jgi:transcriptional regulator NrdR family protein
MRCPYCKTATRTRSVIQSKRDLPAEWVAAGGARANDQVTVRRLHCQKCDALFTTLEVEYVPGVRESYGGVSQPLVSSRQPLRRTPKV